MSLDHYLYNSLSGKTTLKDMVVVTFKARYFIFSGNFNNHIGMNTTSVIMPKTTQFEELGIFFISKLENYRRSRNQIYQL